MQKLKDLNLVKEKIIADFHYYRFLMRASFIATAILISTAQSLLAVDCYGQGNEQKIISLHFKNASIQKIFSAIESMVDVTIMYENTFSLMNEKFDVSVNNKKVADILDVIFKDRNLSWSIRDNVIRIQKIEYNKNNQPTTVVQLHKPIEINMASPIKIKVIDSVSQPLAGATVGVRKKSLGGITNSKGEIILNIAEGDWVDISFVGYQTQSVRITNSILTAGYLNVQLITASTNMEEINVQVNTGYQTISRERTAGAFSKPDMEILRNRSTSMNVLQRLDGLIPGLTVNNSPSATANPLLIRGLSTLNAQMQRVPLYVVDGVVVNDVSTINPQSHD